MNSGNGSKQGTNVLHSTTNTSATRIQGGKQQSQTNRMVFPQGTTTVDHSQQNLTDIIQKREISSTYIKRILDNQAVLK